MRSRDEVLSEYMERPDALSAMADRIRELEAASGEPVAWVAMFTNGETSHVIWNERSAREWAAQSETRVVRPLVFGDAPPSAAGVTVTEAMVEAGAQALALSYRKLTQQSWESASETWREEYRADARTAITAAFTAASERREEGNGDAYRLLDDSIHKDVGIGRVAKTPNRAITPPTSGEEGR